MGEQEEFLSSEHNKLLNIAAWAKHLAWVVLVIYLISTAGKIVQFQNTANFRATMNNQPSQNLIEILKSDPLEIFELVTDIAATVLKGIVYYLVLKGISLGLNMIVETDINYREQKEDGRSL